MKHIGLVLSGGMAKGAYQIGALTAISEFFDPSDFEYVSAASVGALNTYAFLTGNLKEAQHIWECVNLQGERVLITSMLKSTFLQDVITALYSEKTLPNNYYVPLVDILRRELDYYDFKTIPPCQLDPYLRASVAMPFYNRGVQIGDKTLYDGAVVDNIPIYPVLSKDLDYVICIYFDDYNYIFEDYSLDHKIIKLTFPDNKLLSNSVLVNHNAIMQMIDSGYSRAKNTLSFIFADGTCDLDSIYAKNKEHNTCADKNQLRITGDVVVTNMNRMLQKLIRRKQIVNGELINN